MRSGRQGVGVAQWCWVQTKLRLSSDHKRRVVRKLAAQTLRARNFGRPADVIQVREPEVVETGCADARPAQLACDTIAPVCELPRDRLRADSLIDGGVSLTPEPDV
jgi:hypothetical protein